MGRRKRERKEAVKKGRERNRQIGFAEGEEGEREREIRKTRGLLLQYVRQRRTRSGKH